MFIIALFTIHKIWKLPEFQLMDECIKKVRYICLFYMIVRCTYIYMYTHTYTYIPLAKTWVDLEGIMPSKIIETG